MMREFIYGQFIYKYELIRQERKTLSLTVRPDRGIVLKCPVSADENHINAFLKRKWKWLNKQLDFFKKFQRNVYKKEYISGESFMYLGRQYQLIVKRGSKNSASLTKGKLLLYTKDLVSNGEHNKHLIDRWYEKRIKNIFEVRLEEVFKKFNYEKKPMLVIRKMNKRWGSFLRDKTIILNPRLIHVSKDCIDYVIVHELCHIKHKSHDKRFYDLLSSKIFNWEKKREKLEMSAV